MVERPFSSPRWSDRKTCCECRVPLPSALSAVEKCGQPRVSIFYYPSILLETTARQIFLFSTIGQNVLLAIFGLLDILFYEEL